MLRVIGGLLDARAFALGLIALVNPCGFALLPAYLGFFLTLDGDFERRRPFASLNRAQLVAASMSTGFLAVFAVLGLLLASVLNAIAAYLPWVTLTIGVGLIAMGIATARGFQPLLSLPKLQKGTDNRSVLSMFLFGVSYATASLSCTIPIFVSAIGSSATGKSFIERLGGFVSYGLGMALAATGLTLAIAVGRDSVVGLFRSLLPRIQQVSAITLIIVGAYVAWYGYWATDPIGHPAGPVLWAERLQGHARDWVNQRTQALGIAFLLLNAGLLVAGFIERSTQRQQQPARPPQ